MRQTNQKNDDKTNCNHSTTTLSKLDYYKISIPWLQSLIWPMIIIFLVLLFKTPVQESLYRISEMITRTNSIQYKGMVFEITEAIAISASSETQAAISGISEEALFMLIEQGVEPKSKYAYIGHISWDCPQTKRKLFEQQPALKELEKRDMITISEYSYQDCTSSYHWIWTDLGLESHKVFMDILTSEIANAIQNTP